MIMEGRRVDGITSNYAKKAISGVEGHSWWFASSPSFALSFQSEGCLTDNTRLVRGTVPEHTSRRVPNGCADSRKPRRAWQASKHHLRAAPHQ